MSSLDLGTLKVGVKVDGTSQAKSNLNDVNQDMKNVQDTASGTSSSMGSLGDMFKQAAGQTKVFGVDLGSLVGGFDAGGLAAGAMGGIMAGVVTAGISMAKDAMIALVAALGDFIKDSMSIGIDFQAQMSKVQALTGETGKGLGELTDIARDFGASTVFSTQEVAQAMQYMGQAGWETQQIMDGMSGILDLAASSGEDLALVSDTVTDVLTALGESAEESGRMADVFAVAAAKTNTDVAKLAYTMKYAAPIAGALSYSMEDVSIAAGLMANAGIKSETAGTALRSMFTELSGAVTITSASLGDYVVETENSDGSMRELLDIITDLRTGFDGLTESEKRSNAESLVGKEAMGGLLAIVNASDESFNSLTESIYNAEGAASEMAGVMVDNVGGTLEEIGGKFESIKISLFTAFEPLTAGLLKVFSSSLGIWDSLIEQLGQGLNNFLSMFDPLWTLLAGVGEMVGAVISGAIELGNALTSAFTSDTKDDIQAISDVIQIFVDLFIDGVNAIVKFTKPMLEIIGNVVAAIINLFQLDFKGFTKNIEDLGKISLFATEDANKKIEDETSAHYEKLEGMNEEHTEKMNEISSFYESAMNKEMAQYEKELRSRWDEETRSGRAAIAKRLEMKREELEEKYRMEEEFYNRVNRLEGGSGSSSGGSINRYANGTLSAAGGWSVVGETGRELMYVPPKGKIINNNTTEKMLSGGGGTNIGVVNVYPASFDEFISEMDAMNFRGNVYND